MRIRGDGTELSAAHADMDPTSGYGAVGLGRVGIIWSRVAKGWLRIRGLLLLWGGIGYGPSLPRSSQGSKSRDMVGFWALAAVFGVGAGLGIERGLRLGWKRFHVGGRDKKREPVSAPFLLDDIVAPGYCLRLWVGFCCGLGFMCSPAAIKLPTRSVLWL